MVSLGNIALSPSTHAMFRGRFNLGYFGMSPKKFSFNDFTQSTWGKFTFILENGNSGFGRRKVTRTLRYFAQAYCQFDPKTRSEHVSEDPSRYASTGGFMGLEPKKKMFV